jgi:hypothetical protein
VPKTMVLLGVLGKTMAHGEVYPDFLTSLRHDEAKFQDAVLSSCTGRAGEPAGGWVGANKNEPLTLGSPNLVQRFAQTPS